MPGHLADRSPPLDLADQLDHRRLLRRGAVLLERIIGPGAKATQQANPDGSGVVPLDMGADLGLGASRGKSPIVVDDPVKTDVSPAALLYICLLYTSRCV